jgi:hypothetical protein
MAITLDLKKVIDFKSLPPKVARSSINELTRHAKTTLSKSIREKYNLRAKTINAAMSVKLARGRDFDGEIHIKGKRIGLEKFGARQTKRGVKVKVKKTAKLIRHAFMVPSLGNKVFARKGPTRLPIRRLTGPSVPQLALSVFEKIKPRLFTKAQEIVKRKVEFYARKKS